MVRNKIFGFDAKEYYALHSMIANNCYIRHSHKDLSFDEFVKLSPYIEPIPYNGMEAFYVTRICEEEYKKNSDCCELQSTLNDSPVYAALCESQYATEAYSAYEKLDLRPLSLGIESPSFLDGEEIAIKYDRLRFIGEAAMYYSLYLYESEHPEPLRKNKSTKAKIRNKLIGRGAAGNGPLVKLRKLIDDGYGLTNSSDNTLLKALLTELYNDAVDGEVVDPQFDKHLSIPRKRFSARLLSRLYSRYGDPRSDVELVVYHLMRSLNAVEEVPNTRDIRDEPLRDEVRDMMTRLLKHREVVLGTHLFSNDIS